MLNTQNLRTPSTDEAREMQEKSAKKRSDNIKEKKLIREIIEKRLKAHDLNEIVDNLIERAKTDSKDFEVLQAAMGQKPIDKVVISEIAPDVVEEVEKMVMENDEE